MSNIKSVRFHFEGPAQMQRAIEATGMYRPSDVAHILMYEFNARAPGNGDVALSLHFTGVRHPKILFEVREHAPDQPASEPLATYDISIPKAVGGKDWEFYLQHKTSLHADVKTHEKVKIGCIATSNFHDILASRLQKTLEDLGLVHKWAPTSAPDSLLATEMPATLLGIIVDHRELLQNPETLSLRIGPS